LNSSDDRNERLIVVPFRPKRKLWILLLLIVGYAVVATTSYRGGQSIAEKQVVVAVEAGKEALKEENTQILKELSDLKSQIVVHQQHVVVQQKAVEMVRKENQGLQNQIDQLEEQLAYYQRVVRPDSNDKGLLISELDLEPTTTDNGYHYAFNLVQISGRDRLGGYVNINVIGHYSDQDGQEILNFNQLNKEVGTKGERVGFKYFQELKGELTLPKNFLPKQVEISADITTGKKVFLKRLFEWRVRESVVDVEKAKKQ